MLLLWGKNDEMSLALPLLLYNKLVLSQNTYKQWTQPGEKWSSSLFSQLVRPNANILYIRFFCFSLKWTISLDDFTKCKI